MNIKKLNILFKDYVFNLRLFKIDYNNSKIRYLVCMWVCVCVRSVEILRLEKFLYPSRCLKIHINIGATLFHLSTLFTCFSSISK